MIVTSPQIMVFEYLWLVPTILSCLIIHKITRRLFKLSLHKGLKYFSNAFGLYALGFSAVLLDRILGFNDLYYYASGLQIIISFIAIYLGGIGGFYLTYSLMWKIFEEDRIKRFHPERLCILGLVALLIAFADTYLMVSRGYAQPYIFFSIMILLTFSATLISLKKAPGKTSVAPFTTAVGLAFCIYAGFFIEGLLSPFIPTVHFYISGVIAMFFVSLANNVVALSK